MTHREATTNFIFAGFDSAMLYRIGIISNATRNNAYLPSNMHDLNFLFIYGAAANCMYLVFALILYGFSFACFNGMDAAGETLKSLYFFAFCSGLCMSMYFGKHNNLND